MSPMLSSARSTSASPHPSASRPTLWKTPPALTTKSGARVERALRRDGAGDAFRAASARIVTVPVGDGWDNEPVDSTFHQALPRLAYFTPDFHNPTGRLTRNDERAALVASARRVET